MGSGERELTRGAGCGCQSLGHQAGRREPIRVHERGVSAAQRGKESREERGGVLEVEEP